VKRPSFIWVITFWLVMSLLFRPGWLVFSVGCLLCVVLMYLKAPGEFWHCIGMLTFSTPKLERYLARSVAYRPLIPQPYLKLGLLYFQRQEWSKAIPLLQDAITLRGDRCPASPRIILATAYREDGQPGLAIPVLQGVIDRGTRTAEVYYNLALCLLRLPDPRAALDAATAAHTLDPTAVRPVMIMGSIHFGLKDFATAKQDYQWLITVLPKPVESLYWLGRAELELGEIQPATAHLRLALDRIGERQDLSNIPLEEVRHWLHTANGLRHDTPASPPSPPSAPGTDTPGCARL
jgi:tetratricopeptide (TPR) repeat protein